MNNFSRYALLVGALAMLFSACLPVRTIQDKISGIDEGTTKIGPSWPITLSIPMFKGATVDVGESLDGFEGVAFEDSLMAFEQPLGERTIDIGFDRKEIEIIRPPLTDPSVPLPAGEFYTPIDIDDIVTATLASGAIRVELQGLEPPDGEKIAVYLKDGDEQGDVILTAEIAQGESFALLSLDTINLTSRMVLTAEGNLTFPGGNDGYIIIESVGPFELEEVVLRPDQLHSRFDAVIIDETETITLPDDIRIDHINLDMELDVNYEYFTANNLAMSLSVSLIGYDRNGAIVESYDTTTVIHEGTVSLYDLTRDFTNLLTDPSVQEIDVYFDKITIEPVDSPQNVTFGFFGEPTVSADVYISIDSLTGNGNDPIKVSTTFQTPEDFPDEIAGGALVLTVNNDSPIQGTFEIWFSPVNAPEAVGAPDVFLQFDPYQANQELEVSLTEAIIDLLRTNDEVLITIQLSGLDAQEAVKKGDVMIIDAYGIVVGRMNNS